MHTDPCFCLAAAQQQDLKLHAWLRLGLHCVVVQCTCETFAIPKSNKHQQCGLAVVHAEMDSLNLVLKEPLFMQEQVCRYV